MKENMDDKKENIKLNFFWQLCIEITNMLLPLITSPILARRIGAESIGIYSYVYSISYCFVLIALLGIIQYGTREIALVRDDKDKLNNKFSELLCAQVVIGIIIMFVYLIYSTFIAQYKTFFLIQAFSLLGYSIISSNWLFSGLEEFKAISIKSIIIRSIGVLCIILFIKDSSDLIIYFWIMALEPLASAITNMFLARKKIKIIKVSIKKSLSHIKGMFVLFIPILTTYLYSSMDKIMLGKMSSMEQLGFYENATKALIAKNLATALSTVLIPRMSNLLSKNDKKGFEELLNKSIDIVLLLTIAFGYGTGAISSIFSVVFWGDEFIECSKSILIMSLTLPAYGLTYVINNQYLIPSKKEYVYINATISGVIINFILNMILIPKYNAWGAAIATFITQYIVLIIEYFFIRKEFSILKNVRSGIVYNIFGIFMLFIIKVIDLNINYSIKGIILEVICGALIFSGMCLVYWKITNNKQYLNIIREFVAKITNKRVENIKDNR